MASRVLKVEKLVEKLPNEDLLRSDLLPDSNANPSDPPAWSGVMREWLVAAHNDFTEEDVEKLAEDPPLFLFTLFEAANDQDGQKLGILGSTVVAEVVAHAMLQHWDTVEGDPIVLQLADDVFDGNLPETMPDLIRVLNKNGMLGRVECA